MPRPTPRPRPWRTSAYGREIASPPRTSGPPGAGGGTAPPPPPPPPPGGAWVPPRRYDETLRKGDCLPVTILNMQVLTTLVTAIAGGCCFISDHRHARAVAEWI